MTAALIEPMTGPRLVYKELVLDANREPMVQRLVGVHHIPQPMAQAMIDQLWERLIKRLTVDYAHEGMDRTLAERIQNEALGFLWLSAKTSGAYGPSPAVDKGWHNTILCTLTYEVLSHVLAGQFLHHLPTDVEGFNKPNDGLHEPHHDEIGHCDWPPPAGQHPDGNCVVLTGDADLPRHTIADTVAAMRLFGPVDDELWAGSGRCSKCTGGDGHGRCTVKCEKIPDPRDSAVSAGQAAEEAPRRPRLAAGS
jgi:hypothetical protein